MYREPLIIDLEDGDRTHSLNRLLWAHGLGSDRVTGDRWQIRLDGRAVPRWSRLYVWPFCSIILAPNKALTSEFDTFCQSR